MGEFARALARVSVTVCARKSARECVYVCKSGRMCVCFSKNFSKRRHWISAHVWRSISYLIFTEHAEIIYLKGGHDGCWRSKLWGFDWLGPTWNRRPLVIRFLLLENEGNKCVILRGFDWRPSTTRYQFASVKMWGQKAKGNKFLGALTGLALRDTIDHSSSISFGKNIKGKGHEILAAPKTLVLRLSSLIIHRTQFLPCTRTTEARKKSLKTPTRSWKLSSPRRATGRNAVDPY